MRYPTTPSAAGWTEASEAVNQNRPTHPPVIYAWHFGYRVRVTSQQVPLLPCLENPLRGRVAFLHASEFLSLF